MGLNFYGNEYVYGSRKQVVQADAVLAGRLLEVLRQHAAPAQSEGQAGSSSSSRGDGGQQQRQCSAADGQGSTGSCAAPGDGGRTSSSVASMTVNDCHHLGGAEAI